MIYKFEEFNKNEGLFNKPLDKDIKKLFEDIKKEFDHDKFYYEENYLFYIFKYNINNITLEIFNAKNSSIIRLKIDGDIVNCSTILKYRIFYFFKKKYKQYIKIKEKEDTKLKEEEIKNKISSINRKASQYNL